MLQFNLQMYTNQHRSKHYAEPPIDFRFFFLFNASSSSKLSVPVGAVSGAARAKMPLLSAWRLLLLACVSALPLKVLVALKAMKSLLSCFAALLLALLVPNLFKNENLPFAAGAATGFSGAFPCTPFPLLDRSDEETAFGSAVVCNGASALRLMKPGAFHTLEHILHLITCDGQ